MGYTAPPFFVESLLGRSNRSLPRLPLNMNAEAIIPSCSTWNISSGLGHPKALTLTQLRSYEMFEVLRIVRINNSVGLWGILKFRLLRERFRTGWREGFHSRRDFHSLYNRRSELHPLIFTEQFLCFRYHSTRDFYPVSYTMTVHIYYNHHTGYKQL